MFTPNAFRMPEADLRAHAARYDFGLLTIADDDPADPPLIAQIPMLLLSVGGADGSVRLIGHVARANPIWRRFDGMRRARALFPGPHAYIAPAWYAVPDHQAVPTWNYTAVEAVGTPRIVEAPEDAVAILETLARAQEPDEDGWRPTGAAAETVAGMLKGIAAFEMPVDRLSGKAKLSQNRAAADRAGVVAGLRAQGGAEAAAVADLMAALDRPDGSG